MAKKVSEKLSRKDYEKLGKLLVSIGELGIADHKKIYRISFVKGLFTGLGGVIGATLIITLILFVLSLIGDVPLIGDVADTIENSIQQNQ